MIRYKVVKRTVIDGPVMRDLDIKIAVLVGLGAAAIGLIVLLENFALNNVPEENVVYIDAAVGSIENDDPAAEGTGSPIPDCDTPSECGLGDEDSPPQE